MANKKYGSNLSAGGRRLGRHLPRIASGDVEDEPGPDRPVEHHPLPPPPPSPQVQQQTKAPRRAYQERREQRLRGTRDLDRPSNAEDVAGVTGRLKLSKDNPINNFASPLPSKALAGARWGLWADVQRHLLQAYEYLCHVGEAQQWIEGCLGQELGFGVVEMDERLRDGVVLAKLVRVFQGEHAVRRIYEASSPAPKLDFRHSDNINAFFNFVREVGLPEGFIFELTDLYNKKNIPKVIYCVHALSHLLARQGLAERIGNLLGQLQFSDEQLQQTHKGLKDSGVPMPNFGNIGRELFNEEPEEEPETEEERRDRLLLESESSIVKLQAQARATLAQRSHQDTERRLVLAQRYVAKTQAICRGYLVRREVSRQRQSQTALQPWARALQAVVRGRLTRQRIDQRVHDIHRGETYAVMLQAQIRGVLQRRRMAKLRAALRNHFRVVTNLQAVARANRVRQHHDSLAITFDDPVVEGSVALVQALGRGVLARRKAMRRQSMLRRFEPSFIGLQAQCRAVLIRRRVRRQMAKLEDVSQTVVRIQAAVRTYLARKRLLMLIRGLRRATPVVIGFQAKARAKLARQQHESMTRYLGEAKTIKSVGGLQAFARAALARKRHTEIQRTLDFVAPDVVGLQAQIRGAMVRLEYYAWRDHLWHNETVAVILQSMLRGAIQRRIFHRKMAYYRANLSKVIKIQSLVRAKETREQYRQLTMGTNVTVGTIKNFVHLLDDSEADFQEELKVERLRKQVVESIRENQALENDVGELDTRIGLLVENAKTFEDVMKTRRGRGDSIASHAARTSLLAAHGDPFAGPSTLTHEARKKLELYQQLFYLLQTHGEYLGRLFIRVSVSDSEDNKRFIERAVLNMFGYGHDRREDYLLLKLFSVAIREDIKGANSIDDVIHGHPMYLSVAIQYVRPKHAVYIRDTLQAVVRDVVESDDLDLEVDPSKIHRQRITLEEEKTGRPSTQPKDLPFHAALTDPKTRADYIRHLQMLQWRTDAFVNAMIQSTNKMPYGMRYLIRETLAAVRERFPDATDQDCVSCIARLVFYRFINPAIMHVFHCTCANSLLTFRRAPETFNLVEDTLDLTSRRNLGQISTVIQQIASGIEFNQEPASYVPINGYVSKTIQPLAMWFFELADVPDPEAQMHAHEFLDATVQPKPIYISPNEIYKMHRLLSSHRTHLLTTPAEKDRLAIILDELNGVPYSGNAALDEARDIVITLELSNRWATVDDTKAVEKAEWVKAKRAVLAVVRVQPAEDLWTSLMKPVTEADEEMWEDILEAEELNERQTRAHPRQASQAAQEYKLQDIRRLEFHEVKALAIKCLLKLEEQGKITRVNNFQDILNDIAYDVRSKHRRRLQRQQEMQNMQEAIKQLGERKRYFQKQIDAYSDYMKDALSTMQRGKKQRVILPFTKQYKHKQNLQRSGRTPKFGSYLYTAKDLYDRQIILSVDQYSPRQFDKINIVMSSNDFGVFTLDLESSLFGVTSRIASQNISMSELLDAKYENRSAIPLFDGKVKANTEKLLFQINKKCVLASMHIFVFSLLYLADSTSSLSRPLYTDCPYVSVVLCHSPSPVLLNLNRILYI
ncbi:hypothetical protein BD626DRAFT_395296 [Schizophyllum amplum]|uniref:Uncharacterized protein n=1 Tax=Schizophyllum amplum TaxID=97359 RepID=A0A550CS40_9AGAR|nr:hypothetical protein BD626DRAFT_395296 [Auriculariopsis ampla]